MRTRNKKRLNASDVKRQALENVSYAKSLASWLKVEASLLEKIALLEQEIQNAKLDRRHPETFCKRQI